MNEAKLYENESEKKTNEEYQNNNKEYNNEKILNDEDTLPLSGNLFENKNDKLLNNSEANMGINEQYLYKSQVKNLISNENVENNKIDKLNNYGNIGQNIVLCNKYVLGIKSSLLLFIFTFIGMVLTFIGWVLTNNYFYSIYIYIIGGIPFILTQIFFILCFLVEPGIIPRNDPNFLEKKFEENNNLNQEEKNNILIDSIETSNKIQVNNNNINNFEKKDIKIKKQNINVDNGNEKNQISVPKIFTERKCSTCGIIRPPCASHCRYCDNCILNLDHHCFYISNCVGKRNHKYFYLFLFFGSLSALYASVCNIILILYIFLINSQDIWKLLFINDKWLLILSFILITFSGIYALLGCFNIYILFGPSGIGYILFCFLFYKNIPNNYESFRNPFGVAVLSASTNFGTFVIINFIKQTRSIGSGLTLKQNNSIQNEILNNSFNNKKVEFDKDYLSKKNIKEQFNNIIKFLTRKIDKSLIIPQRDLFKNK